MLAISNQSVLQVLLNQKANSLYALYDAAQDNSLLNDLKKDNIAHDCLFTGIKEITLRNVAPYLLSCSHFEHNPDKFIDNVWARGVSMLVESSASVDQLKVQLKKNAFVKNSGGVECYFRYYDARAFSRFIRSATDTQLSCLFGTAIHAIYWLDTTTNGIVGLIQKKPGLIGRIFDAGNVDFDIQKLS